MPFDSLDNYLLESRGSKADAIAALLSDRSGDPHAAPFYRALDALGARVADEALIALRLVLAGKSPDDAAVKRLRELVALSRGNGPQATHAREAYAAELL